MDFSHELNTGIVIFIPDRWFSSCGFVDNECKYFSCAKSHNDIYFCKGITVVGSIFFYFWE